MKRVGFTMRLEPGAAEEYKRLHDELWPELVAEFQRIGIEDYVIYLDPETNTLFASQLVGEHDRKSELRDLEIMHRWWASLGHLMETNSDNSPVVTPLLKVFELRTVATRTGRNDGLSGST